MNTTALQGQRVVIVGASSGIGKAVAVHAARAGCGVVMVSRSMDKLEAAARSVPRSPTLMAVDMLDGAAMKVALAPIAPIDHLVLTAVADVNKRRARVSELTDEQFERSVDKLRGFFNVVRAAVLMSPRGSIILTSGGSTPKPPRQGMSVLASIGRNQSEACTPLWSAKVG